MNTSITHDPFEFPTTLDGLYSQMKTFLNTVLQFTWRGIVFTRPDTLTPEFQAQFNGRTVSVVIVQQSSIAWMLWDNSSSQALTSLYYTPFVAIDKYLAAV